MDSVLTGGAWHAVPRAADRHLQLEMVETGLPCEGRRAEDAIGGSRRRDILSHHRVREIPESLHKSQVPLFIPSDPVSRKKP